jgi:hypothetical protein
MNSELISERIGLTGMIPFIYFYCTQTPIASTDLRVEPIIRRHTDFEKWVHGRKYDNLIFQQTFWKEMAMLFRGPKIIDICDPDWIKYDVQIVEQALPVDAITCSSAELRDLVKRYFPDKIAEHVPDRFDFSFFPEPHGLHQGKAKKAVWFGFIHNAHETLPQLAPVIRKSGLELLIIANAPYSQKDEILALNPHFVSYEHYLSRQHIAESDMLLNPRSDRASFRYKSNNKSVIAWKLRVPVAVTGDDIARFIDPDERNREAEKYEFVENEYDIEKSVQQYQDIFRRIRNL